MLIAIMSKNITTGMSTSQAIDAAITYCLEQDILTDVLLKNRSEVCHMLLTEFDEKKFAKTMWKEGHEAGYSEGHESGHNEIFAIMDEINKGNDTIDKLTELGYDEKLASEVLKKK